MASSPAKPPNTSRACGETPRPSSRSVTDDYHLTEDLARDAIGYIRTNRALNPDKPLFLYFAPGAVHGPHHVPAEWADKYSGQFDDGWEALREKTFERQKELGWIPQEAELTPIHRTHAKLGGCARGAARLPDPSHGGLRRFPRAHRHPVRQDRRRAGSPGHPRQHAHLLHRLRQRRFGRRPGRHHLRAAGAEPDGHHGRGAD